MCITEYHNSNNKELQEQKNDWYLLNAYMAGKCIQKYATLTSFLE